jgi:myosin heavy subunit
MPISVSFMRKLDGVSPEIKEALLSFMEEVEVSKQELVTRSDFNELKEIVRESAEIQRKTEQRLDKLEVTVQELAEAQKRTEQRLNELAEAQKRTEQRLNELAEAQRKTEEKVNELAEAQKRTEQRLNELAEAQRKTEEKVNELAEAQKRTEQRLNELAEAQRKTEEKVNELAEAQKRTEQRLNELAEAQEKTEEEVGKLAVGLQGVRGQVGGLSRSVAYALENEAYRNLPSFLKEKYGIEVIDRLIRFDLKGEEINLFARAKRNGEEVILVGESVLRLDDKGKLKDIKRKADIVFEEYGTKASPIIVTHFATSRVMEEAKKAGFLVIQSFEW